MDAQTANLANLKNMAAEIPNLSGQAEVDMIGQAAAAMKSFRQAELQMIQQLQAAQKNVDSSFEALFEKYKIAGFTKNGKTDYQGEEAYLQSELQRQYQLATTELNQQYQLALTSTDPGVISQATARITALMDQMAQLAIQANPANADAWNAWILDQGPKMQTAIDAHLKSLVDPLIAMNAELEAAMKPVIDAFLALGDAMGANNPVTGTSTGSRTGNDPGTRNRGGIHDPGTPGDIPDVGSRNPLPGEPGPGDYRYSTGGKPRTTTDAGAQLYDFLSGAKTTQGGVDLAQSIRETQSRADVDRKAQLAHLAALAASAGQTNGLLAAIIAAVQQGGGLRVTVDGPGASDFLNRIHISRENSG